MNMKTQIAAGLLATAAISGCGKVTALKGNGVPPQLWSDHKELSMPVEDCAAKGEGALSSLGFTDVVRNGTFSYGNLKGNRAAVKCVHIYGGSFVYFTVAGSEKETVENLRNEIARKFR
jgi:hypothetical protein